MSHFVVYVIGEDVEEQLAPFDENIEVEPYESDSREDLIQKSKERLQYGLERRAEWLADPADYEANCYNDAHIRWLREEIPEMEQWTDDQHYAAATKFYDEEDFSESGGLMSTYNPKSQWDWWVIGGRWSNGIVLKDGQEVDSARAGEIDWDTTGVPFALVHNGEWIERGSMGWFGLTSNEKPMEEWEAQARNILLNLPDTTQVTLVDCHI